MSYVALSTTEIETGDPVSADLWEKVRANFVDHESRLSSIEAATQTFEPIKFVARGAFALVSLPFTGEDFHRIFTNITLTAARLLVPIAGSAGTWDFDVQYKRGGAAFASIFSTRPSVAFGAGDYAVSSNAVMTTTALLVGDILRFDVRGAQTESDQANLYLQYEVT